MTTFCTVVMVYLASDMRCQKLIASTPVKLASHTDDNHISVASLVYCRKYTVQFLGIGFGWFVLDACKLNKDAMVETAFSSFVTSLSNPIWVTQRCEDKVRGFLLFTFCCSLRRLNQSLLILPMRLSLK